MSLCPQGDAKGAALAQLRLMNGPFRLVCGFFTTCPVGKQDGCPTLVNLCNILLFGLAKLLLLKKRSYNNYNITSR